jgi:hypothetical protein
VLKTGGTEGKENIKKNQTGLCQWHQHKEKIAELLLASS